MRDEMRTFVVLAASGSLQRAVVARNRGRITGEGRAVLERVTQVTRS